MIVSRSRDDRFQAGIYCKTVAPLLGDAMACVLTFC